MNCTAKETDPLEVALLVVTPVLVVLGVAANSINIVVLTRKWMASSTNNYLTALAVTDLAYLTAFYIITVKFYPGVLYNAWFAHALSYLFPLANLLSNYATWLTCLFTFERWLVIYKPMLGRKYCTRRRAKHLMAGLLLATVLFTFPNFFEYRAVSKELRCDNATWTVYGLGQTDAYSVIKRLGYYHLFASIFVFGPLIFLVVFNGLLIRSVIVARRKRAALGSGGGGGSDRGACSNNLSNKRAAAEQQKVTTMLIAVVLVFCLCQLPSAIMTLKKAMQRAEERRKGRGTAERIASALVNILLLANAACNFVLYSCFSTRFRNTFRQVFLKCGGRRQNSGRIGGVGGGGGGGGGGRGIGCGSGDKECGVGEELQHLKPTAEVAVEQADLGNHAREFDSNRPERPTRKEDAAAFD